MLNTFDYFLLILVNQINPSIKQENQPLNPAGFI